MSSYVLNIDPVGEGNYNPLYRVILDGQNYSLNLRWDELGQCFHLKLAKNGSSYFLKTKVMTNADLLVPYKTITGCPQGELMVYDLTNTFGRISYEDFGYNRRFVLIYTEPQ